MRTLIPAAALCVLMAAAPPANAQHLIWKPKPGDKKYTCLYGEIEVLATGPTIYYCGCNWWPGNPAGGYCGIQDAGAGRHLMIFSIWDTSPTLHPKTTQAESRTKHSRFGGEGTGAHTHLDYDWPLKKTFRYYVTKEQDADAVNTLTRMYYFDEGLRKWVHEATISNPNDGHESVTTCGGMLNAFLENWSGLERSTPKLALYRLWVGTTPKDLANVTEAMGDGKWGVMNEAFYLAEGDDDALANVFEAARKPGTPLEQGKADRSTLTVPSRRISAATIRELGRLPKSPEVREVGGVSGGGTEKKAGSDGDSRPPDIDRVSTSLRP